MTDIPVHAASVPARLGVTARLEGPRLVLDLHPERETMHHGVVRASVLSYVVDAVAGMEVDGDGDRWTLTSDLSVRMRPVPAPGRITGVNTILRRSGRSATCAVELTAGNGEPLASGLASFVLVPRRHGDPPKPSVAIERQLELFGSHGVIAEPLREAAGVEVLDAARGILQLEVTAALRNPNGTLQGAMVALLAEAAAEDIVAVRTGLPAVVVDLDVRYLARAEVGPVQTRSRLLGEGEHSPVEVLLVDTSTDTITAVAYCRATEVSSHE